ncbi:hypothetical protein MKK67_19995 [Methylobacterium sp. J-072]|uniref:hypothetical protein n=1 Tax=Methylobacterium sp. J-072 TaxID=2836651 RepID=UPI001FB94E89|nr:hypothetical protein [Methylobacterium sp. J-072]MCJ2094761.1 hypothetical protein [Methylobacterium sp. J-072]
MTGVDIFVLFVLPALILAGSLGGLWILNRSTSAKTDPKKVTDTYNVAKILRVPVAGE